MLGLFGDYSDYFKLRKSSYIDNATFRLHYRLTFGILLLSSMLATTYQFFGGPIDCMTDAPATSAVNTYCWISGTFTLYERLNDTVGIGASQPGVGHMDYDKDGRVIYHAYYQWVCFVLCLQAILCYLPHYIWLYFEGDKLSMLIQGLDGEKIMLDDDIRDKRKSIANYFIRNLHTHNSYVFKFVLCEFLNIVNIAFQIWLMNTFFEGQFMSYGRDIISVIGQEDRIDPMSKIFPKMTKCNFHFYGPSGTIQIFDSLCLLPINIINEKTYVFIWFWFIILIIWTSLHFISRLITIILKYTRLIVMNHYARSVNRDDLEIVVQKCNYGDWFLLIQLGKNINPAIFHDLLLDLRDRIDRKRADNFDDSI